MNDLVDSIRQQEASDSLFRGSEKNDSAEFVWNGFVELRRKSPKHSGMNYKFQPIFDASDGGVRKMIGNRS